jgi:hypothetical protein
MISFGDRMVHIALMGDPTLRAATAPVATLGTLTASTAYPNIVNLSWVKPTGDVQAYMVYRRSTGQRRWKLLTDQPITSTSFRDSLSHDGTLEYMVRCCALRQSTSGTYYESGKGRITSVITTGVADTGPLAAGPLAPHVEAGPNPASTELTLRIGIAEASSVEITLVDLRGVVVHNQRFSDRAAGEHAVTFDVDTFPSGMYMLRVRTNGGTAVHPVRIAR